MRLLDLIGEILPFFQLKNVHDIVGFGHRHTDFLGDINVYSTDFHDVTSEWIEDTLAETFHRKALDAPKDRGLLFLYRLLMIKQRIHYPAVNNSFQIDHNLQLFLERWICQAFVDLYVSKHPEAKDLKGL